MVKLAITRRNSLQFAGAVTASSYLGIRRAAAADPYPSATINFVIPFGPGGTFDAYGREFSMLLTKSLGVNVEPINDPGAGGMEAIVALFHEKPDGYTFSLADVPGTQIRKTEPGEPLKNLTWVANLGRDAFGLAVGADSPIKNLADLQAISAKRPIKFAATGVDSAYVATKIFLAALGLRSEFITGYESSVNSSIAAKRGDVDAVVFSQTAITKMQKSGILKLIFVFQNESPSADVENALSANQPDLGKVFAWRTVVAPPGLPPSVTAKLSSALVAAAKTNEAKAWADKIKATLYPLDHAQTLKMLAEQDVILKKWHSVF